jgi:hypothetical protein
MSHTNPDIAQEARIREKLTNVKPEAFDEFITEHRDGYFDENSLDAWLAKRREDRPHRFIGEGVTIDPKLVDAARNGNKTAESKLFLALGKDRAALDKLLAEKSSDKDGSKNPWRSQNFRTDKTAQAEAARIISTLGTRAAASMAKSAGKTLTGTPLRA